MFARVSTYESPPDRMQEGISHARERILPAVRNIAGFSGILFLADREIGKVLSITLWESEQGAIARRRPAGCGAKAPKQAAKR